jgi:hypothetical protein
MGAGLYGHFRVRNLLIYFEVGFFLKKIKSQLATNTITFLYKTRDSSKLILRPAILSSRWQRLLSIRSVRRFSLLNSLVLCHCLVQNIGNGNRTQ